MEKYNTIILISVRKILLEETDNIIELIGEFSIYNPLKQAYKDFCHDCGNCKTSNILRDLKTKKLIFICGDCFEIFLTNNLKFKIKGGELIGRNNYWRDYTLSWSNNHCYLGVVC